MTGNNPTRVAVQRPSSAPLAEQLQHLLTLADRLPSGEGEDHVRRCVCEVIEAEDGEQRHKAILLLGSISQLQHAREYGRRRDQQAGAPAVERLLTALCGTIVPLLQPSTAQGLELLQPISPAVPYAHALAVPFDEEKWNRWTARGRVADAAFAGKVRILGIVSGAALLLAGVVATFVLR